MFFMMHYWQKDIQLCIDKQRFSLSAVNGHGNKLASYPFRLSKSDRTVSLSYREAQIVVQLLFGRTASKMARVLGLSPRTVEFYLLRIKQKFNCQKRSELIQKLKTYSQLQDLL